MPSIIIQNTVKQTEHKKEKKRQKKKVDKQPFLQMIIPFPEQAPLCQQYEEIWISSHQANVEHKHKPTVAFRQKNIYTDRFLVFFIFILHHLVSLL